MIDKTAAQLAFWKAVNESHIPPLWRASVSDMANAAYDRADEVSAELADLRKIVERHDDDLRAITSNSVLRIAKLESIDDRRQSRFDDHAYRLAALEAAARTDEQDPVCICGHSQSRHANEPMGHCHVSGCGCRAFRPQPPAAPEMVQRTGLFHCPCFFCYGDDPSCDRCAGDGHLIVRWDEFVRLVSEMVAARKAPS